MTSPVVLVVSNPVDSPQGAVLGLATESQQAVKVTDDAVLASAVFADIPGLGPILVQNAVPVTVDVDLCVNGLASGAVTGVDFQVTAEDGGASTIPRGSACALASTVAGAAGTARSRCRITLPIPTGPTGHWVLHPQYKVGAGTNLAIQPLTVAGTGATLTVTPIQAPGEVTATP